MRRHYYPILHSRWLIDTAAKDKLKVRELVAGRVNMQTWDSLALKVAVLLYHKLPKTEPRSPTNCEKDKYKRYPHLDLLYGNYGTSNKTNEILKWAREKTRIAIKEADISRATLEARKTGDITVNLAFYILRHELFKKSKVKTFSN